MGIASSPRNDRITIALLLRKEFPPRLLEAGPDIGRERTRHLDTEPPPPIRQSTISALPNSVRVQHPNRECGLVRSSAQNAFSAPGGARAGHASAVSDATRRQYGARRDWRRPMPADRDTRPVRAIARCIAAEQGGATCLGRRHPHYDSAATSPRMINRAGRRRCLERAPRRGPAIWQRMPRAGASDQPCSRLPVLVVGDRIRHAHRDGPVRPSAHERLPIRARPPDSSASAIGRRSVSLQ